MTLHIHADLWVLCRQEPGHRRARAEAGGILCHGRALPGRRGARRRDP